MKFARHLLLTFAAVLPAAALADNWVPVAGASSLSFTAEQQGAAFDGEFREFTANFELDPAEPTSTRIEAVITMNSVYTAYDERDEYLRGEEWFHVERWPEARFVTEGIKRTNEGFLADAVLTLRDQSRSIGFAFTLETQADGRLGFRGVTKIRRLEFGVGQGQWTNTEWVGDEVTIRADLLLEPALP